MKISTSRSLAAFSIVAGISAAGSANAALISGWDPSNALTPVNANASNLANTVAGGNDLFLNQFDVNGVSGSATTIDDAIVFKPGFAGAGGGTAAITSGATDSALEIWFNFGGATVANNILFETGASGNGFGLKATATGIEFNHDAGAASDSISVDLSTLNLNNFVQVVALIDASTSLSLRVTDITGTSVTATVAVTNTASGTGNQAGLGTSTGASSTVLSISAGNTGGNDASATGVTGPFLGQTGLIRFYDVATFDEADASFEAIVPEPGSAMLGASGALLLLRRRRAR